MVHQMGPPTESGEVRVTSIHTTAGDAAAKDLDRPNPCPLGGIV
ncbi:MAG: hypothetical protein JW384_03697 [Nitrosomonadaceae bacterium]|nr:hypothetical protein [Nitrosomonadaceae bacterium]